MNDQPSSKLAKDQSSVATQVGVKATRKLQVRRNAALGVWFGLGRMEVIGWSVVVPTVFGAALGLWMDQQHPGTHSWALALMVAGLVVGCANAWHWIVKEDQAMHAEQDGTGE
jgi:ATP synthase protein I